jgi:hypothetical protein
MRPYLSSSSQAQRRLAQTFLTRQMEDQDGHPISSPKATQSISRTSPHVDVHSGILDKEVSAPLVPLILFLIYSLTSRIMAINGLKQNFICSGLAPVELATQLLTRFTGAKCSFRLIDY